MSTKFQIKPVLVTVYIAYSAKLDMLMPKFMFEIIILSTLVFNHSEMFHSD